MASGFFHGFHTRFDASSLRNAFAPRKPRNPLLRLGFGLLGIALLALLIGLGLVVGACMLAFGLLRKLVGKRARKEAVDGTIVDAEYRVVPKQSQPALR